MRKFWEKKIGEKFVEFCYSDPNRVNYRDERWSILVTDVKGDTIQVSVTVQRITPSGLLTGELMKLGSIWTSIQPTLEETLDEIIHGMALVKGF